MFQSPWMLLGLGAAAFILLAHRLFRQPAREVRLASIRFLSESKEEPVAPHRWQDLPLMALRLLLWTALALTLARPQCSVQTDIEVFEQAQSAVIVIDAGARTHHRVGDQNLWEHAMHKAKALVDALPQGSWIALATLEPTLSQVVVGRDKSQAQATLQAWEKAGESGVLARQSVLPLDALAPTVTALLGSAPADLPKVGYFIREPQASPCPRRVADLERWICTPSVDPARIKDTPLQLAITQLDIAPTKTLDRSTYELTAKIENRGSDPTRAPKVALTWFIDDQKIQHQEVQLRQGKAQARWFYGIKDTKPHRVRVQLSSHDDFDLDDRAERWLQQAEPLRVLLVDGDPSEQRAHDEVFLLATALRQVFKERGIAIQGIDPAQLQRRLEEAGNKVPKADLIVLANVSALSKAQGQRLAQWVEQGMGLWITAGSRVQAQAYNHSLEPLLPLLLRSGSASSEPPLALRAPDLEHPLFVSFADPRTLVGGRTERLFLLEPDPKRPAKVALSFSNGAPALVTREVGKGRVAWWSTSIDRAWTDLVLHPGYVPLVQAVVNWLSADPLAGTTSNRSRIPVGTPIKLSATSRVRVQGPTPGDGRWVGAAKTYRPARLGLYESSRTGANQVRRFSTHLDPSAGEPPKAPPRTEEPQGQASVSKARSYQGVWTKLWPLIALALVGESLLRMLRLRR